MNNVIKPTKTLHLTDAELAAVINALASAGFVYGGVQHDPGTTALAKAQKAADE